jgi:hypothetical protein
MIFDTVGRKIPSSVGLAIAGISVSASPWCGQVYPGFLIFRIFMSVGIVPGMHTPLLADYLYPDSLGLANAYVIKTIIKTLLVMAGVSFGRNLWINRPPGAFKAH